MSQGMEWQMKAGELREKMIAVMEEYSRTNPNIPAQVVMAALGELLIQFSVSQAGKANTMRLLSHLGEAVNKFGDQISPHH